MIVSIVLIVKLKICSTRRRGVPTLGEFIFTTTTTIWLNFSQFISLRILDKTNFEVVIVIIFLSISFNICIGYSKELCH